MNQRIAALSCTAALVASLAACGSEDDKPTLPLHTGGSTPSTTATSRPTMASPAAPTNTSTTAKLIALDAHSTRNYNGLTVVVNLPADIPKESRSSTRTFSDFLQGVGRTTAQNRLDPTLSSLASVSVVKFVNGFVDPGSIQGIGDFVFTITDIHHAPDDTTRVIGCLNQSTLLQVRSDGSHFVAASTKKNRTLKMFATITLGKNAPKVNHLALRAGTC